MAFALTEYYNEIVYILEGNKNLKNTFVNVAKASGYAAGGAATGGLVGGPVGALIGTMIGGIIAYTHSPNYDSLITVLKDMDKADREEIALRVRGAVGDSTVAALRNFMISQVGLQTVLDIIKDFVPQK